MARIRIVTDSASDIPSGMYPGVTVVPLAVTFGDEIGRASCRERV